MKRLGVPVSVFVLLAGPLVACGGDGSDGGGLASGQDGGPATTAAGHPDVTLPDEVVAIETDPADVTAFDNSFEAAGIRVPTGTTVRWTNRGHQDHDVLAVEGEWGVEVTGFHPGGTYAHTFDRPGTYSYYCTIHGTAARGMVGVVVVE